MKTITAIKAKQGGRKQVTIFLDGDLAFSLEKKVAGEQALTKGQVLSGTEIENLRKADLLAKCQNSALRLLNYRPRSESELRSRLHRNHDGKIIDAVITNLRERNLIDDRAFAAYWKENREAFSPRSKRLIGLELKYKGVPPEVIIETLGEMDDEDNAYHVALRKARALQDENYKDFHRKLASLLVRRGFNWETINRAITRVWQENH